MISGRLTPLLLAVCLVASLSPGSYAQLSGGETQDFRRGEIIVEIEPGASIDAVNNRIRTTTIERINGTNFYRLRTPEGKSEEKWRRRAARDRNVLSSSLNLMVVSPTNVFARATVAFPGDQPKPGVRAPEYTFQPELFQLLNLRDAQLRSRGAGVVVAIIDTGIARSHPDLGSHLWKDNRSHGEIAADGVDQDQDGFVDDANGWDFVDNDNDPSEAVGDPAASVAGHGTFIAGLVALLAPECRILPIRAFTPDGVSNAFIVAAAIKYAADHGAGVINLSFGSPKKSGIVRDAIRYARQRGVFLVAAVGNEHEDTDLDPQYPANLAQVIGVAALDRDSRKAEFSNFGSRVSVAAPGVSLISTYPGGDYAVWSGTSFAAPLTTAQGALLLAESPGADVRRISEETAESIDHLNLAFSGKLGKGRINPLAALESIYSDGTPAGNYYGLTLTRGTGDTLSEGHSEKLVTGGLQLFRIIAPGLKPRVSHKLVIDGKDISPAGLIATNFGGLVIDLSNESSFTPESGRIHLDLPSELNPVTKIKHVELREGTSIVLQGDFSRVGDDTESDQLLVKRTSLATTGVLPQAAGKVNLIIVGESQEIRVAGNSLTPGAIYFAVADGVGLGAAVAQSATTQSGFVRLRVTGDGSSGHSIPPALRPITNIRQIELRDSSGRVILKGEFLPGGGGG